MIKISSNSNLFEISSYLHDEENARINDGGCKRSTKK